MSNKIIFILVLFLLTACTYEPINELEQKQEQAQIRNEPIYQGESVLVASWNLQIFGQKKSSNDTLMDYYVDKINDYDIIFIQEIRDKDGTAFAKLCSMLPEYNCEESERAGSTSSKEQVGLIYKKGLELIEEGNIPFTGDYEREPYRVLFNIDDAPFVFYSVHLKPDQVIHEMRYLGYDTQEDFVDPVPTMIIGDLNADCSYYDAESENYLGDWFWLIKDWEDTTVSETDCAYDRIIVDDEAMWRVSYGGIMKDVTKDQSDHYLVWVEII